MAEIGQDQAADYASRKGMTLGGREVARDLAYDLDQQNGNRPSELPQARSKSAS